MKPAIKTVAPVEVRCAHCGCILFELVDDILVVKATHHGEQHQSVIPLAMLAGSALALPGGKVARF